MKTNNLINNNKSTNVSIEKTLLPNETNLNNLKTEKYFTIEGAENSIMTKALISYRQNENLIKYINGTNINFQHNPSETSSTCTEHLISHKNENNIKTRNNKLPLKMLEISKNEISENNINTIVNEDDFNDSAIINKNDNFINDDKKIHHISELQNIVNINNYSIFDEDSFNDDINNIITGGNTFNNFHNINEKKYYNHCMIERNLLINSSYKDINFKDFLLINNIFNELIHDFDVNKMHCFENKIKAAQNFFKACENSINFQIYEIFDINSLNNINKIPTNNNLCLLVKEYLILQLIFFYILILISLVNKDNEKLFFFSGIKKMAEYLQQNCIIFIYIIINNLKIQNELTGNNFIMKDIMKLIKENKNLLSENNYKKSLAINNKDCKEIIKNLLKQIKNIFNHNKVIYKSNVKAKNTISLKIGGNINSKPIYTKMCKKYNKNNNNNISGTNDNNNIFYTDFIETIINLFTIYLKNIRKVKFSTFLKDLKKTPSILHLLSITNIYPNKKFESASFLRLKNKSLSKKSKSITKKTSKNILSIKPYTSISDSQNKYILVLDLEGTLINYASKKNSSFIQKRPNVDIFLKSLSKYYEIILFSDSLQKFTEMSLKNIDKNNYIKLKFYRQHCLNVGGIYVKDLDKIRRDIKKIIIIDDCSDCFCLQPRNGLNIIEFDGNEKDNELENLRKDLIKLAEMKPNDVRNYLKNIQNNIYKRVNKIQYFNNTYEEDFVEENNEYKEKNKKEMDMEKIPEIIYENEGDGSVIFGGKNILENS